MTKKRRGSMVCDMNDSFDDDDKSKDEDDNDDKKEEDDQRIPMNHANWIKQIICTVRFRS